jgi:2-keto-4-pentenoate hydratase/2-oxohepta-3-ene-1,7-dioic acid hydratase in catechol pathway
LRINSPRTHTGGTFEIWFFVASDPDARRALWVRHTTLRPRDGAGARAITWAAAFPGPELEPIARKCVREITTFVSKDGRIETPGAQLAPTSASGQVASEGRTIAWDLSFGEAPSAIRRAPPLLEALPLPVGAEHVHARTAVQGWVSIDGARFELGPRSRLVQAHLWGTRQAEEITWIWAPSFTDEPNGGLELVAARLRAAAWVPNIATLVLDAGEASIDGATMMGALRTRITRAELGLVEARVTTASRRVVVRAHAPPASFVGYVYRGPNGRSVHVAQSDVGRCNVELYRRRGPLWVPERTLQAPIAAIEIHRRDPLPGLPYLGWEDEGARRPPHRPRSVHATGVPLPRLERIFAFGFTYRDHVRETGSRAPDLRSDPPIVFEKNVRSVSRAAEAVAIPSSEEMLEALDRLEPGLGAKLARRYAVLPALMDYEVELGLVVLERIRARDLADPRFSPRVAWFLANDLTARSCQILGEGRPNTYAYWALAKSFTRFLPVSPRALESTGIDSVPLVGLRTVVGGELRQDARTSELLYTPRQMLEAATRFAGGDLDVGSAVLTGTPAGVGLRVARWKKALADRFLDRFGKLDRAIDAHARGDRLLRCGDEIVCSMDRLGERRVRLV